MKGARLQVDWKPGTEEWNFATGLGFNVSQIERIADDFRDYWIAKPGKDGVKLDWPATWRRWVRKEADKLPRTRESIFDLQIDLDRR